MRFDTLKVVDQPGDRTAKYKGKKEKEKGSMESYHPHSHASYKQQKDDDIILEHVLFN